MQLITSHRQRKIAGMRSNKWGRLLAYVTGSLNKELLLQNKYLAAENRILRAKVPSRLRQSDSERALTASVSSALLAFRSEIQSERGIGRSALNYKRHHRDGFLLNERIKRF